MKGIVYFIKSNSNNDIKIGYDTSESGMERFNTLKTAASRGLDFVGYIPADNCPQLEKEMHEQFAEHRQEGEWFELGIGIICQEILKHGGSFGYPSGQFVNTKPTKSFDPKALLNKRKFLRMLPKTFEYNDIDNFGTPYYYKNFNLTKQQAEKIIEENCTRFKDGRSYRIRKNKVFQFPVQIDYEKFTQYPDELLECKKSLLSFLTKKECMGRYGMPTENNHDIFWLFLYRLTYLECKFPTYVDMFFMSLTLDSLVTLKNHIFSIHYVHNHIHSEKSIMIEFNTMEEEKIEKIENEIKNLFKYLNLIKYNCNEIWSLTSKDGEIFYDELLQNIKKSRKLKKQTNYAQYVVNDLYINNCQEKIKSDKLSIVIEIFDFIDSLIFEDFKILKALSWECRVLLDSFKDKKLSDYFIKNHYICKRQ